MKNGWVRKERWVTGMVGMEGKLEECEVLREMGVGKDGRVTGKEGQDNEQRREGISNKEIKYNERRRRNT